MELNKYEIRPFFHGQKAGVQFLYFILFIIAGGILSSVLAVFLNMVIFGTLESSSSLSLYLVNGITTIGTFLLPALLFSYCSERKWFSYSQSYTLFEKKSGMIVVVLALMILPIIAFLGHINEQMQLPESLATLEQWMKLMEEKVGAVLTQMLSDRSAWNIALSLLLMAVFPAICEEYFFRGTLQPLFGNIFKNKHVAIWLTAFVFSAIHFQFYGFLPRFLLGAYLGYLLLWSRTIWLPILAHFLHNTLTISAYYAMGDKASELEHLSPSDIPGFYPMLSLAIIVTSGGIYLLWKERTIKPADDVD